MDSLKKSRSSRPNQFGQTFSLMGHQFQTYGVPDIGCRSRVRRGIRLYYECCCKGVSDSIRLNWLYLLGAIILAFRELEAS